jgi:phage shock protein PspC (stress-responsive transcriptional regulator)
MLAGVCAGIARYAGVDPTLVRIAAVVGLVLGFGTIGLVYLLLWAIVPEDT